MSAQVPATPLPVQIVLHFVGPDGRPAANREIVYRIQNPYWNPIGGTAETDASGTAKVLVSFGRFPVPDKTELVAFVPGQYCSDSVELTFQPGQRRMTNTVPLRVGGSVRGTVRDETTGIPLGGVVLQPLRVAPDDYRKSLWNEHPSYLDRLGGVPGAVLRLRTVLGTDNVSYSVSGDGDGGFEFHHLPEGEYDIVPFRDGNFEFTKHLAIRDGQTIEGLEISVPRFPKPRGILGNVSFENEGAPMVRTEILFEVTPIRREATDAWTLVYPRRTTTGLRGGFYLHPIPSGDYSVIAFAPGYGRSKPQRISISDHSAKHVKFILVEHLY